ncbi:MAG: hypothetical protein KAR83_04940 [Thermodesulfovibrionales bacterium]|nr:hypothetical protein [Thermodesulfovibrionales bacterium]
MRCVYAMDGCTGKTKVIRTVDYGYWVSRKRKCKKCGEEFTTQERQRVEVFRKAETEEPEKKAAHAASAKKSVLKEPRPHGRFPGDRGCY